MDKRGPQCVAYGCKKRKYSKTSPRSDSEGSEDEESCVKRKHPRTFHMLVYAIYTIISLMFLSNLI